MSSWQQSPPTAEDQDHPYDEREVHIVSDDEVGVSSGGVSGVEEEDDASHSSWSSEGLSASEVLSTSSSNSSSSSCSSSSSTMHKKTDSLGLGDGRLEDDDRPLLLLRIKCSSPDIDATAGGKDVEVETYSDISVLQLKENIRSALGPNARGRYLRLITGGRLLAPDSARVGGFKLKDGDCVHAVLAAAGVRGGQQAALSRGAHSSSSTTNSRAARRRLRGLGIGSNGLILPRGSNETDEDSEDDQDDVEQGRERLGFDRLRSAGLTRDEIAAIRIYFASHIDRYMEQRSAARERASGGSNGSGGEVREGESNGEAPSSGEGGSGNVSGAPPSRQQQQQQQREDPRRERLRVEDEWMRLQGPTSEFRLNLGATADPFWAMGVGGRGGLMFRGDSGAGGLVAASGDADFGGAVGGPGGLRGAQSLVGTDRDFVWGFLLGFFVGFIMLFWVWMPTVPHRQKLGILTGICFHMALRMIKENENGEDLVE